MAHGWDSYFPNGPPLSSDSSTLIRTSESEGSVSQHIENFIGHHDFPGAVESHEAPATNSNFNTNYYSNPRVENPSSDCLYQRYCKETPWQADGEQMESDYLPKCENNDISDFATDGLSTSGSFPSSFATDLHELKQDCGILATSFLEDYSDVSSCSDADVGETRPSCKFMASNSVPKPKTDVTTKSSSAEWLFTDAGNMMLSTESLCPNVSKTNIILPGTSNVAAGVNLVECAQDKMETSENKDVERDLTEGKNSNISLSGHENLTGDGIEEYPDMNAEEQIAATAPNIMTTLVNEQDPSDEKILRKKIKESFNKKNEGNLNSTDGQDRNKRVDTQDKSEDLKGEREDSSSFENNAFDEQKSPNPNCTDGQDENMETDCQKKEIQSNTSPSSAPRGIKDVTHELRQCTNTSKIEVESCLQLSEHQSLSNASDKNEQGVASHSESCLQPNRSSTDVNPCVDNEMASPAEKKTTSSSEPVCIDPPVISDYKEQSVSNGLESCSQSTTSTTDINPCLEKEWKSPAENTNATSSPNQQQPLHQNPVALQPGSVNGDVAENARESFEELVTSAEETSVLSMPFGEPLSTEDSSCETDETKLDTSPYKDTSVARPDSSNTNYSEGQAPQLKSSFQMRKQLQPVVLLKTSESINGMSNSYHCADCQHTTHNIDHLIKHHYCCHTVRNFQFCKICNLYLMSPEQAESHVCRVTKTRPQVSPDSSLPKRKKRRAGYRCNRCALMFSKVINYIKHMRTHTGKTPYKCNGCGSYFAQNSSLRKHKRIPGRCKQSKLPVTNSDAAIKETKTSGQKDLVQNKPYPNLPECYVKLVDISKSHPCTICGKSFSTAIKIKKHYYNVHRGKSLAGSSSQCTTKHSSEKTKQVENETTGRYKCPLCPRLFKYSYNRARHLRDCVRDAIYGGKGKFSGKYRCPLCHVTFTLPSNRYRHIKTFCLREYVNQLAKERVNSNEQVEQKKTKEIEQKMPSKKNEQKKQAPSAVTAPKTVSRPRFKCSLCPAVFFHPSGKSKHMKKHELFKLTGKMFKYRRSSILYNQETSSSTKTEESKDNSKSTETNDSLALSCNFCGRCFNTPQSLKKHERNHRGERPYRCLECGKTFKKRAYLIGHKRVHQRRIQCTVCRKILPTVTELIQHRSSHLKRGMLQCPDCHLQFQYPAHLLRHLDVHKHRENKARQLEERPPLKPQLSLESTKEQSGPKQLQCSLCKEVFDDAHLLRKHCLSHISGPSSKNQCPFCKQNFNSRRYLVRHMLIHTGDKSFSCTNCGKQFYRDLYLKLHKEKCLPGQTRHLVTMESDTMESDTKIKGPLLCSYCPRTFCKQIRLKKHHIGHKTNTLLLCSKCELYFGSRRLSQHQKNCIGTKDGNTGLSSPKSNVSKSTSQTSHVRMPLRSNANKLLPLKCPHCPHRVKYRSLLLRHLVSHTGVQPYACMHCGHRFGTQTMCLQHEAFCDGVYEEGQSKVKVDAATHLSRTPTLRDAAQKPQAEGEVEYKCKFCTKTFLKSRSLRRHILTHNEVKPYHCKACDSCFSRYDHLKVHQARCKGKRTRLEVRIPKISLDDVGRGWKIKFGMEPAAKEETFECEVCSRSFSTQSKLSRHITMFHVTKMFKCTRCGSSFSHEKTLKKHWKMKKCRKRSNETKAPPPPETNPPAENVTNSLRGVRNRIIQRIQPYLNQKYKYACSHCPRAFGNSWQLGVHTRLHTGERPYACDCGERFIRKDYMQRHSAKCTKKTSRLSKSTVRHSQRSTTKSPPKGFSCAYCSSRFLLFSQLQEHFLSAHQLETKAPPVSTAPLQHHLSNIPNIKEEPMDESPNTQLSDGANVICKLDTALNSEIPNQFSCPECNLCFANKAGLTGHLRIHTRVFPFNCKICKRGFWNKSLLRNHNRKCRFGRISERTAQQLEVPLKAEIDCVLDDSVLVFKEASTSTGTGVLQTNFSHKDDVMDESPQNSEENQVQSSSSKEKKTVQYQCSECDKSFTDGLMLISHLEDHGREEQAKKRNACHKCGQVFTSSGNLERHMKLHGINKKYSCPDCPKVLDNFTDFEVHRTCHDQNRPFTCKLCNHRFWTRPSLCSHYREEHLDDVFTCRFCNNAYSIKRSLSRHYKKWHKKEQRDLERMEKEKRKEKGSIEQQSSSQISTTGESDEDENNSTEDSDSDSAPYFPCHVCGKTFPTSESLEDHQRCHLGEKPHECAECGRCFFQASQLQQHQRMHKSEHQCQACGRGFVSLFALRKHKHTHGKSRPYRCSKCDYSFTGPLQLAEHMSTHREENFPCDICNLAFPSKSSRAVHWKSHSKPGGHPPPSISREEREKSASLSESSSSPKDLKYRCGVCGDRFRDPEELSEHGCMAAKERPYSCSDCDKHFLHASHLKKHRTTHQPPWSNNSEYPCNQCNNSFPSSQSFHSHLKNHLDTAADIKHNTEGKDGGFICPVCDQYFVNANELIRHFPTHPDGTFECKICKMTFPSGSKLQEHERSHVIPATEFQCMKCNQRFLGRDAFSQHHCSHQQQARMEAESSKPSAKTSLPMYHQAAVDEEEVDVTGEDLYNCPVCTMQFYSKSSLLEHQNKQHQNEKPFKCKLCGKTFGRRRYLKEHERRHRQKDMAQADENKFQCTQCYTDFSTAQALSSHMRMHAEEEVGEYRCDMCYKSFSQWSHLKQHQESHVGQVVYECTECDKAFAFPHLLEEHQQTHAGSSQ